MADKVNRMISLDAKLDAAMKKKSDVNWSAVAAEAFQMKLDQLREIKNMQDVIERLKASDADRRSHEYVSGMHDGEEWAKQYAETDELRRLERYDDDCGIELEFASDCGHTCASITERLNPGGDPEQIFGDDTDRSENYLHGFCAGALRVWKEVKSHI